MAFVAGAEILQHVLRPLIGLGEQHAVAVAAVEFMAQAAQYVVGLGQVLVDRALALDQIGHGVEPQAVDPEIEPEPHDVDHRAEHPRIVEIEIGLMRIEPVPVISLGHRVPSPIRLFGIDKDDAGIEKFLVGVAPHVEIAQVGARIGVARALEPGMLIRGVIDHELGDDPQIAAVRLADKLLEVVHPPVGRVDVLVVGNVVAVVAQRRGIERQQPQAR